MRRLKAVLLSVVGIVVAASSASARAQCIAIQRSAAAEVMIAGQFDSYESSTQLDYLVVDVDGDMVYVVCSTDDSTGCDEFNANDTVQIYGHLENASVCDDGKELHPFNRVVPDRVYWCDPLTHLCGNLADETVCAEH